MTGIIHFIDHNHGLLENNFFLAMCWNMIYYANKANNFDISYLSELKVPSSFYFSYLGSKLDHLKMDTNYYDCLRYNPNLICRSSHLELYNMIYYSELRCDHQQGYFFKLNTLNQLKNNISINTINKNNLYYIKMHCSDFLDRALNRNIVSIGFKENHPFYIDQISNDIIKMRAITSKPPLSGTSTQIGTSDSYIMNITYDVPIQFIKEMRIYKSNRKWLNGNNVYSDLATLINNSDLVNMPKKNIDTLKIAINGNFYNRDEPLIDFNNSLIDENINYNDTFNELQVKLKDSNMLKFDTYKNKSTEKQKLLVKKIWK